MGVVYSARDEERGEVVALKVLRRLDGLAIYRFKHEFRALADVVHPHLVPLYELESSQEHWFFTMELIDGTDLLTYVRTGSTTSPDASKTAELPPPTVTSAETLDTVTAMSVASLTGSSLGSSSHGANARSAVPPLFEGGQFYRLRHALAQLGAGVQALHNVGTLHRDIKPSNVIVDRDGHLRLLDFGVVTELAGKLTTDGGAAVVGTPAYMAPEQGTDRSLTTAGDWYSVGIVLYEALTGRRPFEGSIRDMLELKRALDPPAPSAISDMVPPDLNALCVELLARAPEDRPTGENILRRLGIENVSAPARPANASGASVLVGRQRHLTGLREALDQASAGTPVAMFVHGDSGMGKSALIAHFCGEATKDERTTVLSGRCYEQESVPFKALDDLMDGLANTLLDLPDDVAAALLPRNFLTLARLFPVLRRLSGLAPASKGVELHDPHEQRQVAVNAFRELLALMAGRGPLIMHIDDVQWGDRDSAGLLADVLRPPAAPPVLFIASYRTEHDGVGAFMGPLAAAVDEYIELPVTRLEPGEARTLARTLLDGVRLDDQHADAIAHEARGNPFFVTELVQHVAESVARNQDGLALTLNDVIAARLAELSDDARSLLNILAVAGRPIAQVVALRSAQIRGREQSAVILLRQASLARTRGVRALDSIEVYHDRIRESVYELLDPKVRRELHLRLAHSMQATAIGDAEGIGAHLERGGELVQAGRYYVEAAEAAAKQLAFDRAGALYLRAIELIAPRPADRSDLFARAADAYTNAGKGKEAAHAYELASEDAGKAMALRYRGRACEELLRSGHVREGQVAMRSVLREVGVRLPHSKGSALLSVAMLRARVRLRGLGYKERDASQITLAQLTRIDVCWAAGMALAMSDPLLGTILQARHLLGSLRTGERTHITRALALEAAFASLGGSKGKRRTLRLTTRVLDLAEGIDDQLARVWAQGSTSFAFYQLARFPEALEYADLANEQARGKPGMWWERSSINVYRSWTLYWLGKFRELADTVPELLRDAETRGDLYAYTNFCNGFPAMAWLVRDKPDEWLRIGEEAMERWSRDAYHLQHYWHMTARCHRHLYLQEPEPAMKLIVDEWPKMKRALMLTVQAVQLESWFLRGRCAVAGAAVATDANRRQLLGAAQRDARSLRRTKLRHATALAAMLQAGIAGVNGDTTEAVAQLRIADEHCRDKAMAIQAAIARRQLGLTLGGDEGATLVVDANALIAAESVVDIDRFARLFLPGFTP